MSTSKLETYGTAVGNALNVTLLVASLVYAAVVIYFTQPDRGGLLDEQWNEDGFCIHNKHVDHWSSFDTCLYVDVIFSSILAVMWWKWRSVPGMDAISTPTVMIILSTLGHGFAHGGMAAKLRKGRDEQENIEDTPEEATWPMLLAFCGLFWFPLLKAAMPKMNSILVALFALMSTFGPVLGGGLKKQLGFAYIQTIVSIALHISQLSLPTEEKKAREYMTMAMTGVIPMITAWIEALFCGAFFQSLGGHVWYDAAIILSYIIFYVNSYQANMTKNRTSSTKDKTT
ncbi:hypothetical protein IV203_003243 [Nitzschia inconspicua]|uniref:Uncharacterized protein n=1 Tax=Nitzschia inconspicua TaxID=303405 RepID=A0A9K3L1J1_9STRA|nr:hypothetical protein IV203_003243 [Nitzschia inconspicua]